MPEQDQSNALLCRFYYRFLRECRAADFIAATSDHYTLPTLHRLTESLDAVTRRSAVLAVTFMGGEKSVPVVGPRLQDTDRAVRLIASDGIHSVWNRGGSPQQCQRLQRLSRLNSAGEFDAVVEECDNLLAEHPTFAEVWHQRALAFGSQNGVSESIDDFSQSLECDPYHFTSALALGDCYLHLDDHSMALRYFQWAVQIHPDLEFARIQVRRLERILGEQLDH